MPREFGGTLETECLNTSLLLPTLLYPEYSGTYREAKKNTKLLTYTDITRAKYRKFSRKKSL